MPETLDAFFPAGTFLAPRVWETASQWFSNDPHTIEFATGHSLSSAGSMPIICHASTLSPVGLSAMADAGIDIATNRLAYSPPDEYRAHIRSLTGRSMKAVTPFWTPADVVPSEAVWIDPGLLQFLNNKANMSELVPADSLPERKIAWAGAGAAIKAMALPKVVKVGTDLPNGGGGDMMICRHPRHRRRAARRFGADEAIVFEELLDIAENYCVQFAVLDAGIAYIGASSQVCLPNGAHAGNLLDSAAPPPPAVLKLGEGIARNGARLGFSGIAGFDIVVTKDGRTLAIDLNFRLVSSTAQVLLHPRLSAERGRPVSRLAFCNYPGALDDMLRICRPFIDDGSVVPLATFDPGRGGLLPGPARGRILLLANSGAEINERADMLASRGIMIAGSEPTAAGKARNLLRQFSRRLAPVNKKGAAPKGLSASGEALRVEVVSDPGAFAAIAEEWDRLAVTCLGDRSLFSSHAWISRAWLRHQGLRGRKMHIVTIRDHGELVLAAPLVRIADWFGAAKLAWLDSMTPQYNDILVADDSRLPALEHAFWENIRRNRRIRSLKLNCVRSDSTTTRMLQSARATTSGETVAQAVNISPFPNRDAFFSARSPKTRYHFRRQLRLLERQGAVRFRRIDAQPELESAIRWIFGLKEKWVEARYGERNWISDEGTDEFFIDLAVLEASRGEAFVAALELDGALVAATLAFRRGGTIFVSKLAYDPQWKAASPGWLVMTNIILEACDEGHRSVDMMIGRDWWKDRFRGDAVPVANYRVSNWLFS